MKLNTINKNGYASRIFDLLRFLAAFEVLAFHTHMKLTWDHKPNASQIDKLFYAITNHGHQAVIVFFVLSGYFISSSVVKTVSQGKWTWRVYLTNRLTRLWLVLIPALILTALCDYIMHTWYHVASFGGTLAWRVFAGNVFFLQDLRVPIYGQNLPLWSLNYEFWYYILFPAAMLVMWKTTKLSWRISCAVIFALIVALVGQGIMEYFVIWLFGVVVLVAPRIPAPKLAYAIALPCSLYWFLDVVANSTRDGSYNSDVIIGVSFTVLLYIVYHLFNDAVRESKRIDVYKELSGFSYTLYLIHFPLLSVSWFVFQGGGYPSPHMYAVCVGVDLVILTLAWLLARYTEGKTSQVRGFILKHLHVPFINPRQIKKAPTV